MRDREKAVNNHSKMEMIRNNGKVINKIIEIKRNTRRVINKRKSIDTKTINTERKKKAREECQEKSLENNETMMNDYELYPRLK